jgi:serine/threonine protein phosphatase PrpC
MQVVPTSVAWLNVSVHRQIGKRKHMEDRYNIVEFEDDNPGLLAVVCDGHGGARCANFAVQYFSEYFTHIRRSNPTRRVKTWMSMALSKTCKYWDRVCFDSTDAPVSQSEIKHFFDSRDEDLYGKRQLDSGSTFLALYLQKNNNSYHILNLGDSQIMFGKEGNWNFSKMHRMDTDSYLCGTLGMTHAIGDNDRILTGKVKRNPDYYRGKVEEDFVFLMASDGLWDQRGTADITEHGIEDLLCSRSEDNMVILNIIFGTSKKK